MSEFSINKYKDQKQNDMISETNTKIENWLNEFPQKTQAYIQRPVHVEQTLETTLLLDFSLEETWYCLIEVAKYIDRDQMQTYTMNLLAHVAILIDKLRNLLLQTVIFLHQQFVHSIQLAVHCLETRSFLSLLLPTSAKWRNNFHALLRSLWIITFNQNSIWLMHKRIEIQLKVTVLHFKSTGHFWGLETLFIDGIPLSYKKQPHLLHS